MYNSLFTKVLRSICMKRYDGHTKPVPKPRPAKKKGVKQLNPKIPPASEPHPEPSEYMCLVR